MMSYDHDYVMLLDDHNDVIDDYDGDTCEWMMSVKHDVKKLIMIFKMS